MSKPSRETVTCEYCGGQGQAEDFLRRALDKHFKTSAWAKNFVHIDESRGTNIFGTSRVVTKLRRRAKSRLPGSAYRTPAE